MYNYAYIRHALKKAAPFDRRSLLPDANRLKEIFRFTDDQAKETIRKQLSQTVEESGADLIPNLPFSLYNIFDSTSEYKKYNTPYFMRRKSTAVSVILSCLTNSPDDIEHAQDGMWRICDEYTWALPHLIGSRTHGPSPYRRARYDTIDLFSAETAFVLSESLVLLGDQISPSVKRRVREEIYSRIFRPLLRTKPTNGMQKCDDSPLSCGCISALINTAIYLVEDDTQLIAILNRLLPPLSHCLNAMMSGGRLENSDRSKFSTLHLSLTLCSADLLYARTNGELNLFRDLYAGIDASHASLADLIPPLDVMHSARKDILTVVDFDVSPQGLPLSPDRGVIGDPCYRFYVLVRQFLFHPQETISGTLVLGSQYRSRSQSMLSRTNEVSFTCKGGHNDEHPNHNDLGHFTFSIHGDAYFIDAENREPDEKQVKQSPNKSPYAHARRHSVPYAGTWQNKGSSYRAQVIEYAIQPQIDQLTLELAGGYDHPALLSLTRSCIMDKEHSVLTLIDTLKATSPLSFHERFMVCSVRLPLVENKTVTLYGNNGALRIETLSGDFYPRVAHLGDTSDKTKYELLFVPDVLQQSCRFHLLIAPVTN